MLTLAAIYVAYVARLTRGGMLEVLRQDFIRTARAKGLPERTWWCGTRCGAACCRWCRTWGRRWRAS